jgi:hypothetical protein
MNWYERLMRRPGTAASSGNAWSAPPAERGAENDSGRKGPEFTEVHDALARFMNADVDEARTTAVLELKAMGRAALAPLLAEAFSEMGDPTLEPIDIYTIRVAVWCGCALHPAEFQEFYRTRYVTGHARMLDEMRSINMADGMNGQTMIHHLLAAAGGARPAPDSPSVPAPAKHAAPPAVDADAVFCEGMKLYGGDGVPQDYVKARERLQVAAELGHAAAQSAMGILYDNGFGCDRDYQEALKWFQLAAKGGNAAGEFCLGAMYRDGHGVPQDYAEAHKWIRLAAEHGNAEGQFNLGVMYLYGHGIEQDVKEAARWWRAAAAQGNANAKKNLAVLASRGMC